MEAAGAQLDAHMHECYLVGYFFSSRRRHTRFKCDWSSDVCSSDLTVLVTRAEFGGMAANDGPVPVRTLAHAARLIREARQLGQYGIDVSEPVLDYPRLLARVRDVVKDPRAHSSLRQHIHSLGVTLHEHTGVARFADEHTSEAQDSLRLEA